MIIIKQLFFHQKDNNSNNYNLHRSNVSNVGVSITIGACVGNSNAKTWLKTEVMASLFETHTSPS